MLTRSRRGRRWLGVAVRGGKPASSSPALTRRPGACFTCCRGSGRARERGADRRDLGHSFGTLPPQAPPPPLAHLPPPPSPPRLPPPATATTRSAGCDNTPSLPHPVGGKASQAVSPGSPVGEYPPRKETPKSTHARRRPGENTPSDKHELCDRKVTCPRRRPRGNTHASPSYPVRSPQTLRKTPPQRPSRDVHKTLRKLPLRHPQRNLRKPSPPGTWGQSQRRAVEASDTALSIGGGRVLRDTLAAPRCQGRGVVLVNGPSRVYTKLGL